MTVAVENASLYVDWQVTRSPTLHPAQSPSTKGRWVLLAVNLEMQRVVWGWLPAEAVNGQPGPEHPDAQELAIYVKDVDLPEKDQLLSEEAFLGIEDHVAQCKACREITYAMSDLTDEKTKSPPSRSETAETRPSGSEAGGAEDTTPLDEAAQSGKEPPSRKPQKYMKDPTMEYPAEGSYKEWAELTGYSVSSLRRYFLEGIIDGKKDETSNRVILYRKGILKLLKLAEKDFRKRPRSSPQRRGEVEYET